jgi:hypothetical protein
MGFTPVPTRNIIKSTLEITDQKTTYRSMVTECTDIDCFTIQLSQQKRWQRRRVRRPTVARDMSLAMTPNITTTGLDYSIRPMRETEYDRDIESNTIPRSQLSAIISQRSYNGRNASRTITIIMITGFNPIKKRNQIPFLQVNWAQSSVREPTINDAILPLYRQYRKPKAKSRDDCESV